jgi:hypothetical protein
MVEKRKPGRPREVDDPVRYSVTLEREHDELLAHWQAAYRLRSRGAALRAALDWLDELRSHWPPPRRRRRPL